MVTFVQASMHACYLIVSRCLSLSCLLLIKPARFVQGDAFTFAPDAPVAWCVSDVIAFPERCLELIDRWAGNRWAQRLTFTMKFKGESPDYDSISVRVLGNPTRRAQPPPCQS